MARRKPKLVESNIGTIDVSYAESGMRAAFATPADDTGMPPSARTLDPISAMQSGIDNDPLMPARKYSIPLRNWSF
jgi:hypothetical protein